MTRDELLVECFGRSDFPPPIRTVQMLDEHTGDVLSSVDVYLRRVRVRHAHVSQGVGEAATTITVAGLAQVCTDPAHRGKGYASALVRRTHVEMQEHRPLLFAALFGPLGFYGRLGYFHPDGAPDDLLVCELGDDRWPAGRVSTIGEW